MKSAIARIDQSRSSYSNSKAAMLPSFGYSGEASLNRRNGADANVFNAFGTASWELDFWGKLRHAKRSSYAEMLASEEGVKTIQTTLISDVSNLYFLLRDLDARLALSKKVVESRLKYFDIINARFMGGDVSELDKLQAEQQLAYAKATVSSLTREVSNTERALNVLLGQTPQPIARGIENVAQAEFPKIPVGLPSTILDQRPDVRYAELQLESVTNKIGIAQAMRFPTFSLTGLFGLASSDLTSFATTDALATTASATVFGPIFSFGTNRRRVDIARKEAEISANNYTKVYINALGEVESSLVALESYKDEYEQRAIQAAAATKALSLSQERYNQGYADYLEVLIAETYMFDAELQASATKAQQLSAYINLYRSLGGGW